MMRRSYAVALTAALVLLALISVAVAQSRRIGPAAPANPLVRALNEGRYDEVATLAERMNPQEPSVAALVGRAAIARGRYQDAEALLRPIAQRAPTSDAALELGLLLQMLGKSDAGAILSRVAAIATTANEPSELARAARALRAIGQPYESNAA